MPFAAPAARPNTLAARSAPIIEIRVDLPEPGLTQR